MSEASLWALVRNKLSPYGRLLRIEDSLSRGTPDVAYALRRQNIVIEGWIELKHLNHWPAGEQTPIIAPSLTIEQVIWQEEHFRYGGRSCMILQIGASYLCLKPTAIRVLYERSFTCESIRQTATICSEQKFPTVKMLEVLTF